MIPTGPFFSVQFSYCFTGLAGSPGLNATSSAPKSTYEGLDFDDNNAQAINLTSYHGMMFTPTSGTALSITRLAKAPSLPNVLAASRTDGGGPSFNISTDSGSPFDFVDFAFSTSTTTLVNFTFIGSNGLLRTGPECGRFPSITYDPVANGGFTTSSGAVGTRPGCVDLALIIVSVGPGSTLYLDDLVVNLETGTVQGPPSSAPFLGQILAAGGFNDRTGQVQASSELYNPLFSNWNSYWHNAYTQVGVSTGAPQRWHCSDCWWNNQ